MSKIIQFVVVCAAVVTLNIDAENLSLSLDLNPNATLPGLPVSMSLTIKNEGTTPVAVPRNAILIATPVNGKGPIIVKSEGVRRVMYDIHTLDEALPPHAIKVVEIEADGSLNRPYWFQDDVFAHPGQYEVQILLGTAISGNSVEEARSTAVASATARLTVNEPRGTDAEIWKELHALSGNRWHPDVVFSQKGLDLTEQIIRDHPESTYAGFLAGTGPGDDIAQKAAILTNWLAVARPDNWTERRMLTLTRWEIGLADADRVVNPDSSRQHEAHARALLQTLATAKDKRVQAEARKKLVELSQE